jgi:hypothetical protein
LARLPLMTRLRQARVRWWWPGLSWLPRYWRRLLRLAHQS